MTALDTAGEFGGRIAGGLLGGAIGSVFGPIGTLAGRYVGSRLGAMAGKAAAAALANAMEKADEDVEAVPDAKAEPCKDCAEVPCFNMPEGLTKKQQQEFRDQLKRQEDTINGKDPGDLGKAIRNYKRPKNDGQLRGQTRDAFEAQRLDELESKYAALKDGAARAAKEVAQEMAKLDATHALDLVAGGDADDLGMGDRSVNRSIGSQWKSRKDKLLDHADEAKKKGKKNNVKLEICGDKAGGGSRQPAAKPQSPGSGQSGTRPGTAPTS